MSSWRIRKKSLLTELISHDGDHQPPVPLRKAAIGIVVNNPFVGRFAEGDELMAAMEELRPTANALAEELCESLGGSSVIETFGKASIVGSMGEMEHAALWHAPGGAAARTALGSAKAQVPAAKKVGNVGAIIDIPLHYIHASMVRSHYDVMSFCIPDGPKPNELVFAIAMSTGGRIGARIGGLAKDATTGKDGLT